MHIRVTDDLVHSGNMFSGMTSDLQVCAPRVGVSMNLKGNKRKFQSKGTFFFLKINFS